jgi:hypothetical protein
MPITFDKQRSSSETLKKRRNRAKDRQYPDMKRRPNCTTNNTLIQRTPICPCDGSCSRCAPVIQHKLKVGTFNNKCKQDTDRMTESQKVTLDELRLWDFSLPKKQY